MGDVVCKWRTISIENVQEVVTWLPKTPMDAADAKGFVETKCEDFFHTPCQFATQYGLYYIDEDQNLFIPRFDHDPSKDEVKSFLEKWVWAYYAPNPYTKRRFVKGEPKFIVSELIKYIEKHNQPVNLQKAFDDIYEEDTGNIGPLKAFLKFANVFDFNGDNVSLKPDYKHTMEEIDKKNKGQFYGSTPITGNTQSAQPSLPLPYPLQLIYFGTPGSGKSNAIKQYADKFSHFRTTFHPDSDYASFVGSYKPTMKTDPSTGKEAITYSFVAQAFINAYVDAWVKYPEPVFLIVEEINRGNCAQIFGDLFQLLDRDKNHFSDYPINPNKDITKYLEVKFKELDIQNTFKEEDKQEINGFYEGREKDIIGNIFSGEKLSLPKNLYIHATMNTSDQSLFPMDSAFKRRWDWKYIPIEYDNPNSNFSIKFETTTDTYIYAWSKFLEKVNLRIHDVQKSEDKQMGNFFIKENISSEDFRSKVMFYLWSEICKEEEGTRNNFFRNKRENDEEFTFNSLYPVCPETDEILCGFMESLGVDYESKTPLAGLQQAPVAPATTI